MALRSLENFADLVRWQLQKVDPHIGTVTCRKNSPNRLAVRGVFLKDGDAIFSNGEWVGILLSTQPRQGYVLFSRRTAYW